MNPIEAAVHLCELLNYLGRERIWLLRQMDGLPWPRPAEAQAWFTAGVEENARVERNARAMLAELEQKGTLHVETR